jgi:hypothetical protein
MSLVDNNLEHFLEQQNKRRAERENINALRAALAAKLGITEEQAKLLLS